MVLASSMGTEMPPKSDYWLQPEFLSDLLKQLPVHVFWKDVNSVYLGCNEIFATSLGLDSPKEIIGKTDYDLCTTKEESDTYREDDQKIIKSRKPKLSFEEQQTLPNGEVITLLTNKVPLFDKFNTLVGILGVYTDISDKKKLEEEIKEKELLKKQVELSEHIGAVIAHEVRTPLSSIQAGTTCIKDFIKTGQVEEVLEICDEIRGRLKQVENFIDTFLKNARNEKNYKLETCSIQSAIKLALQKYPFSSQAERKLIRINKNLRDFNYLGQEMLVVHVLFNLIKNALYFIAKAEKGHVEIFSSEDKSNHYLHFKDFGMGIPTDEVDYIFDRFYTGTGLGTGIGLSYCKITMNSLNGDISCNSIFGEFAEFILRFPKIEIGD